MADKKYIVAARVESDNKDCIVVEEGAIIMAIHRRVTDPTQKKIANAGNAEIVDKTQNRKGTICNFL